MVMVKSARPLSLGIHDLLDYIKTLFIYLKKVTFWDLSQCKL